MSRGPRSCSPFPVAWRILVVAIVVVVFPALLFAGNCKWISSPSSVAFGTYSVFNPAATTAPTQFDFRCTPNQYARLILSTGGSGSFLPSRRMTSGAQIATYNLFLDAGASQVWGDTSNGSVSYDIYNSSPQDKNFTDFIYGIMPAGQDLAVGMYTDTVIATLGYSNNPSGPWNTIAPVTMTVSVTVVAECRVDSFNLGFGTYSPLSAIAVPGSSIVKVYCTKNTPATFALDNGSNASGVQKRMADAGNYVNYTGTLASGSGTSATSLAPIGGGVALNASIPAGQDIPAAAASYFDTLQVVINY